MFLDFVGAGGIVSTAPSRVTKPTQKIAVNKTPAAPSFMPDAIPVAIPANLPGFGTGVGYSWLICPVALGPPWLGCTFLVLAHSG